jgi:NDP-sugar pyrophosphorylase family protein
VRGGIIAAGEGSRLRRDGLAGSKPMAEVGGRPLIAHALDRFAAAGIRSLSVIINEESGDVRRWLDDHGDGFDLDLVVRTTPSSYASFQVIADRLRGQRAVVTTVDGIMPSTDFLSFVDAAAALPEDAWALGITSHVDDENPLWVDLDPATGRICKLGVSHGDYVTAGVYALPAVRGPLPDKGFDRLRSYLGWLVDQGRPVHGVTLTRVFDIDRAWDIAQAERTLAGEADGRGPR